MTGRQASTGQHLVASAQAAPSARPVVEPQKIYPACQPASGPSALKVLFLTRKWPPAVGGMEVYCRELAAALRDRVTLDVRALPGRLDGRPPSTPALIGFGIRTILRLLTAGSRADVVHGGDLAIWPLVWLALLRARSARAVLSAHGTDIAFAHRRGLAARAYASYLKTGVRLLHDATVIANSHATADLCKVAGFTSISVVPLATRQGEAVFSNPEPYVLFFGRLIPRKGCAWFIRNVLPLLSPEMTLVVAGTAWNSDESSALANGRVKFLGPVSPAERDRLCAAATAVVVPNIDMGIEGFEGFGLAAVEGAAAGGIVLAARLHGLREAVRDGTTGFLLPSGDAAAWARQIEEIRRWPEEKRNAFAERSRATVAEAYSWSRVGEETIAAYRSDGTARESVSQGVPRQ